MAAYGGNCKTSTRENGQTRGVVLVPVTLDERAKPAISIAANLAAQSDARLVMLHVVQLNIVGEERGIQRTRLMNELCREAETKLGSWAAAMDATVSVEVAACVGRVADTIVEAASRLEARAIVLFAHQRRGWRRLFHRNTAAAIARTAPCDVWMIGNGQMIPAVTMTVCSRRIAPTGPIFEKSPAF